MAKLNLQEMYLTEYNRLIVALQKHFTDLKGKTKISEITDWLNARQVMTPITEIDLNKITFTGDEYQYSYGGQTIKLKKDTDLTSANIVAGKIVEGITGTAVDGSVLEVTQSTVEGFLNRVSNEVDYWYYDTVNRKLAHKKGTAILSTNDTLTNLEYNEDNQEFGFKSDDENNSKYYKNFKVSIPKATVTTAADGSGWTISVGYLPESQEIKKLTDTEKTALQNLLEYDQEVLGIKGSNPNIINTRIAASENNVNHIIDGQTYFRNGARVSGSLQPLTEENMIVYKEDNVGDSFVVSGQISDAEFTYLTIPANSYTHTEMNFNLSDVRPENIKAGKNIFGITGEAVVYDLYDEAGYTVQLGTEAPSDLPTANRSLTKNIKLIPSSDFTSSNIRYNKKLLGVNGSFTANDNTVNYVTHDGVLHDGINANEENIKYYETTDLRDGKFAFIDGELCRGTNRNFFDLYEGSYTVKLGATSPSSLPTENRSLIDDVRFELDPDVIKHENIAYGKTILGITGTFSECATNPITADKVVSGFVGYVNGTKITGEMETVENTSLPSSLEGYDLDEGYYNSVNINPLQISYLGTTYNLNTSSGKDTLAGCLRQGSSIFDGKGITINGTGRTVYNATTAVQANSILGTIGEVNEIMHYTGTTEDDGFVPNTYWEIVNINKPGIPPITVPGFDRLFRARELNEATITASDVLKDKIAYGKNGEKITGSMMNQTNNNVKTLDATDVRWDYAQSEYFSSGYYGNGLQVIVDQSKIDATKIKAGTKIFGVTGTYTPSLKTQTFTENKTYKASDENVDGYSEVTVNVPIGAKSQPITSNGTYNNPVTTDGVQGWNSVEVNIPYTGRIELASPQETTDYTFADYGDSSHVAWTSITVKAPQLTSLTIENQANESIASYYNKTYKPESPYVGYNEVIVKLQPRLYNGSATANGEVPLPDEYDGFSSVTVNVTPKLDSNRTVRWSDVVSKTDITPTGGASGFDKIRFDESIELGTYLVTYEDLFKKEILPTGGTNAWTKIEIGTDCEPGSLIVSADDIENNKIISYEKTIYNEVKIGDVLDTDNEVTLTTVPQTFKSKTGKLFKSLTVNADMQDLVINTSDIDSGTTYTAGKTSGQLGWKSVKTSFSKEQRTVTCAEMRKGETLSAPSNVLWSNIVFEEPIKNDYKDATATAGDIVYGKTAVLQSGDLVQGAMAPILVESSEWLDGSNFFVVWPGSNKKLTCRPDFSIENGQVYVQSFYELKNDQNVQPINLDNTYWEPIATEGYRSRGLIGTWYNPGRMSHSDTIPTQIRINTDISSSLTTRKYDEWYWKTSSRFIADYRKTTSYTLPNMKIPSTILTIPTFKGDSEEFQYLNAEWEVSINRIFIKFITKQGTELTHELFDSVTGAVRTNFVYNGKTYILDREWTINSTGYSDSIDNLIQIISHNFWTYYIDGDRVTWNTISTGPYKYYTVFVFENYNEPGLGRIKGWLDTSGYQSFQARPTKGITEEVSATDKHNDWSWRLTVMPEEIELKLYISELYYNRYIDGVGYPRFGWEIIQEAGAQ